MNRDEKARAAMFGALVRTAREREGMTQKDLAALVLKSDGEPISRVYMGMIENGESLITSDMIIVHLSNALGLDCDYLWYLSGQLPLEERIHILSEDEFRHGMQGFRYGVETCRQASSES